jgi:DNA polymerase III delta prime subunit
MSFPQPREGEEEAEEDVVFVSETKWNRNNSMPSTSIQRKPISSMMTIKRSSSLSSSSNLALKKLITTATRTNSTEKWECANCSHENTEIICDFCGTKKNNQNIAPTSIVAKSTSSSSSALLPQKVSATLTKVDNKPTPSQFQQQQPQQQRKKLRTGLDDENEQHEQWSVKYSPRTIEELKLTLDKNKIEKVVEVIQDGISGLGNRLIILHGPTGSGKSTTVKIIAKELGCVLRDWDEESSSSSHLNDYNGDREEMNEFHVPYVRQTEVFNRFLNDCCYPSLKLRSKKNCKQSTENLGTVVLLESLPRPAVNGRSSVQNKNGSLTDSQRILNQCIDKLNRNRAIRTCFVYILTVDGGSGASPTQLTEAVGSDNQALATVINFLSVPEGRMMKTLKVVAEKEGVNLEKLGIERLSSAGSTSSATLFDGDVRSALNQLQFLSLSSATLSKRPSGKLSSSSKAAGSTKRYTKDAKSEERIEKERKQPRDASYEICHAVGKLLRGQKQDESLFRPEDVARQNALDPAGLASFVYENFYKYASAADCDIRGYLDIANALVDADCLIGSKWDELERSGGEDDYDASDAFAESIISRAASSWQKYTSATPKVFVAVTKPQTYVIDREVRNTTKVIEDYLRSQGNFTSASKFLYETLPFSNRATTSHDFLNQFLQYRNLPSTPRGPGNHSRRPLEEELDLDPSLFVEEQIEDF